MFSWCVMPLPRDHGGKAVRLREYHHLPYPRPKGQDARGMGVTPAARTLSAKQRWESQRISPSVAKGSPLEVLSMFLPIRVKSVSEPAVWSSSNKSVHRQATIRYYPSSVHPRLWPEWPSGPSHSSSGAAHNPLPLDPGERIWRKLAPMPRKDPGSSISPMRGINWNSNSSPDGRAGRVDFAIKCETKGKSRDMFKAAGRRPEAMPSR